jgi:hypothetical protein
MRYSIRLRVCQETALASSHAAFAFDYIAAKMIFIPFPAAACAILLHTVYTTAS